ncbi:mechanosensitive ion channel family protein [Faecalibaculum rodentium]|uniref:Mechanosensitive ion channel MscS domain-containing protein n=2 Tax=Faecalibaculum rodentium TaxID=1702221 RepID=A0A140DZ22_9FIRM|nr:mechanosensitive ion channel domain-containing protein [Faecalibaculum rodentium]AMK55899.1 hypothetical protein AALO17_27650 [Faecalibaculum rodentium]
MTLHIDWQKLGTSLWLPVLEIAAGLFLGPLVKRMILRMARTVPNKGVLTFLASLVNVLIIGLTFLLAMEQLGFKMSGTLSLLSAVGLGMTLALKDNMANVAGGLQILLTKPFAVGDYISVGKHQGKVSSIELMYTTIRTNGSKEVIIPNSVLVNDLIVNWSKDPLMHLTVHLHFPLPGNVQAGLEQARVIAGRCPQMIPGEEVQVWCSSLHKNQAKLAVSVPIRGQDVKPARRWLMTQLSVLTDRHDQGEGSAASGLPPAPAEPDRVSAPAAGTTPQEETQNEKAG